MHQQRVKGTPPKGLFRKVAYQQTRKRLGKVPEPVSVAAHHKTILGGMSAFEIALERSKKVPERYKVLGELRASMVAGCEFCVDVGSWLAREAGFTEDELKAMVEWESSDLFDDVDKLVITYADAITRTPVDVPDELFEGLRKHFDEEQLVELTAAIAWENWRARFNWAFGLGKEGFSEGAYCVPMVTLQNGGAATTAG